MGRFKAGWGRSSKAMIYFLRNHYPAEFRSFVLMWRQTTPADGNRARHLIAAALSGLSLIGIFFLS